ncbi:MAG: SDR family oxidoreductase [Pseudomonadota bacterium]|jgi:NAD(P)-dependent dehydrogenase (short-subunit alcohol dehydrogenase family)|nr:SDR family oxidoreductase [Pseudomonadota bacterium]
MNIPAVKSLLDFTSKVTLVTGAGSGLGRGIALRFAEAGSHVVVHYHTSEAGAQEIVQRICERGGEAIALQADATKESDVARLIQGTVETFGRIDVLVNNAGTYPLTSLLEMSPDEWDHVVDANLRGVFLCTQAAAKQMKAQGGGAIVNITSIAAENPAPNLSHYNAAKSGALMFTRASAYELALYGIRVNAVAPGLIWREGIERSWPDGVQRWLRTAPLKRLGMPEDVADACLFLASPSARWITGASLLVDGGVMTHQIF